MSQLLELAFRAQLLSLEVGEITIDEAVETLSILGISPAEALYRLSTAPVPAAVRVPAAG